jgi:hypothetical protein
MTECPGRSVDRADLCEIPSDFVRVLRKLLLACGTAPNVHQLVRLTADIPTVTA